MFLPSKASSSTIQRAKPFLKWVGGKRQLLSQFEPYFPKKFKRYFEPFLGSGAVFYYLWNSGKLPEQLFLFDNNDELINVYCVVRDKLNALIELLAIHQENHGEAYYYKIRMLDRQDVELSEVEWAARTIYLNKTCYNGLYRVNQKKQFNVPIGRYKNPRILHKSVLKAASIALQNVSIERKDFRGIVDLAQRGDFFYFDPPYDPLSKTSNFTSYTSGNFGNNDQQALANVFSELDRKGCLCMLSNSHTPFVLELYQDFKIELVDARRAVNSNANSRGHIKEVLVLNY